MLSISGGVSTLNSVKTGQTGDAVPVTEQSPKHVAEPLTAPGQTMSSTLLPHTAPLSHKRPIGRAHSVGTSVSRDLRSQVLSY